ncbi:MAG: hypothetical protein AB7O59_20780 [Pirellulales bacterium]
MASISTLLRFASREPSYEWYDLADRPLARTRGRWGLALVIMLWIAGVDAFWPLTNVAICYLVPLLLLARIGDVRSLWSLTGLMVVLTFGMFFLKNSIAPPDGEASYFDYRLVNRGLVATTLVVLAFFAQLWIRHCQDEAVEDVPDRVRREDREISSTLAMLCCLPLVAVVGAIDFVSPANYNLAILYPIPLFICAWTGNRWLIWGMLVVLVLLSIAAFMWGPPTVDNVDAALARNRALAAAGMFAVAAVMHTWLGLAARDRPSPPE